MSAAETYLSSFRPVMPVPGFESVLSRVGMQALGRIPGDKAAMQAELAATALREVGANERLQQNLEATAEENALIRSANRRTGAMRMAGELLAMSLPSTSAVGVQAEDPFALLNALGNFSQAERNRRGSNMLRSNSFVSEALKGLG